MREIEWREKGGTDREKGGGGEAAVRIMNLKAIAEDLCEAHMARS